MVGIDPRPEQLPKEFSPGSTPFEIATAFAEFGCGIIDVVAPLVAAIKPQAAFCEMLGPAGTAALARVIQHARQAGLLIILDGKRNDIGSTAEAYAGGWLGADSPWGCDALTINPYMGDDSLQPFIDRNIASGSGSFALVKTSNPGSQLFQRGVACINMLPHGFRTPPAQPRVNPDTE